jgi:hypothetical protein
MVSNSITFILNVIKSSQLIEKLSGHIGSIVISYAYFLSLRNKIRLETWQRMVVSVDIILIMMI